MCVTGARPEGAGSFQASAAGASLQAAPADRTGPTQVPASLFQPTQLTCTVQSCSLDEQAYNHKSLQAQMALLSVHLLPR